MTTNKKTSSKEIVVKIGREATLPIKDKDNKDNKSNSGEMEKPFERKTQIDKSRSTRTIKSIFKNKQQIRFDLSIQRNEVWTLEQKSMLIHSILYGYPIPPILIQETDDGYTWVLNGKQRLTTLIGFLNGDFALNKNTPDVFGYTIARKKFQDLNEDMRDMIQDETIDLIKIKNLTRAERDEMFVRWNFGTSLSKMEITRAIHSDLIEQIRKISEKDFFTTHINLTKSARNRFIDQEIILQIALILDRGLKNMRGLSSNEITKYVKELKLKNEVLSDQTFTTIQDTINYISKGVTKFGESEKKKSLKRVHVPIIFMSALVAIDNKLTSVEFADFIKVFLVEEYSVYSNYGQACQAGSAQKDKVATRYQEMEGALKEYINTLSIKNKSTKAEKIILFKEYMKKSIKQQEQENVTEELAF